MNQLSVPHFQNDLSYMRALLEDLVRIESPSANKTAVDTLALRIIQELENLGGTISIYPQEQAGSSIICRWGSGRMESGRMESGRLESGAGGILVLMHMDTVYDVGTLASQPLREIDGKLFGPGVLDMKASIAMFLAVMRQFKQQDLWPARPVTALFTADEETGSHTSRALVESEARQAEIVFCLEFPLANGALKTARKGTGEIDLFVKGVAAHAGVNHELGCNAIEELAHHILAIQQLTDYERGTTLNVGMANGGKRPNIVPSEAHAVVDLRVASLAEFDRLQDWVKQRQPVIPGTTLLASIELNRPPMPRDENMQRTFAKARSIAAGLGIELGEGSTGGGSDANFVAPLGVAVLDGLGALGEGAHSEREHILLDSLPARAALLAALMLNW